MILRYWLVLLLCLTSSGINAQIFEKGVSKELAELRIKNLSNISYDLTFTIPSTLKENVTGTVTINVFLDDRKDIVLDFQGSFSGACIVNGKKRVVETINEHIIIPKKFTKGGMNRIEMNFTSQDKALNRHSDYMYTLFVPDQARSCFPCFDQPDLRATFSTHINVPEGWKTMVSDGSNPIPTYLYSFVAGKFEEKTAVRDRHRMRILYREQSPERESQLPAIFDEAGQALKWMEEYTGLSCPFKEYGMVVLPGYQFGGMEHPGAIQFSDRRIFLGTSPSLDEKLSRMEIIAHETAHLWFGDMVSLRWFEDVWAKEVYANFMASKITRKQYSKIDYELNFQKTYQTRAIALDRTEGTHPIAQELKNLNHASLLYDDIIYDKTPVMMRILESILGENHMRVGIQKYLRKYYFKNASWNDLIETLHQQNPSAGIRQFSEVWVKQKGMPVIHTSYQDGKLIVSQNDPYGRGLCWRQKFDIRLIYDLGHSRTVSVDMREPVVSITLNDRPNGIIPNYNGRGYGVFTLDDAYIKALPQRLMITRDELNRYMLLQTIFDNYQMGNVPPSYFGELYRCMTKERNPLIMQTIIDHMAKIAFDQPRSERATLEQCMIDIMAENKRPECRQAIIRKMATFATSPEVLDMLYTIWSDQNDPLFNEHDYMEMAYRLAILRPQVCDSILEQQRQWLKSDQLREEFDYVSQACNPDENAQRTLFNQLLKPENRKHEPWALHVLRLLSADVREPQNNVYIPASLESLEYIQQTSDIFFANNWLTALFEGHKSREALDDAEKFLASDTKLQEYLRNKILIAIWPLRKFQEQNNNK